MPPIRSAWTERQPLRAGFPRPSTVPGALSWANSAGTRPLSRCTLAGSPRQHPHVYQHHDGKVRDVNILTRFCGGRGFYVMAAATWISSASTSSRSARLLRRAHQVQRCAPAPLLTPGDKSTGVRSDHRHPDRHRLGESVPDALRRVAISMWNEEAVQVSDQQLHASGTYHRQSTSAAGRWSCSSSGSSSTCDKGLLRHQRECREDQIWIAVSVYVLVAIVRKRLGLEASLLPNSTDFERERFSRKRRFCGHFKRRTSTTIWAIPATS